MHIKEVDAQADLSLCRVVMSYVIWLVCQTMSHLHLYCLFLRFHLCLEFDDGSCVDRQKPFSVVLLNLTVS